MESNYHKLLLFHDEHLVALMKRRMQMNAKKVTDRDADCWKWGGDRRIKYLHTIISANVK